VVIVPLNSTTRSSLPQLSDGGWEFRSISFSSAPRTDSRFYANFNFLTVQIAGSRVATSGVVMLLLPGIAICIAQVVSYFFPMKSDGRITVGITGILVTVAFNWIILQVSPAVAYMTKMMLLSLCCILLCLVNVLIQVFFRSIFSAVELLRKVFVFGESSDVLTRLFSCLKGIKGRQRR
jgi:hypothetical protein